MAHYVLAGGGTGGHLFPGLAVAGAISRLEPDATVTFFTTSRPLDRELLGRTSYRQVEQPVRPLTMKPWRWPAFWWNWHQSVAAAADFIKQHQPRAVLGLGGYAAGPPVVAARTLGIRTAILNPDAIPGRANRYLAGRADLVAVQWDVTGRCFSRGTNWQVLGCPIRPEFAVADRTEGLRIFELDGSRLTLLVTGASQGARSINQTLWRAWPEFVARHPEWQLLHLTGTADEAETRSAYAAAGVAAKVLAFTHEMPLALAAADVVVSRAGASTLAEITALGKPSILFPYPFHRDQHQRANGLVLADAGAALLLTDGRTAEANLDPLRAALERLADEPTRGAMSAAAARLGRIRAADEVAAWLRR